MCKENRNGREQYIAGEYYERPNMQIFMFEENSIACDLTVSNGIPEGDSGAW